MVDKCDANFIGQFFYQQLEQTNIFIGNYPSELSEVIKLSNAGVTGVLNVMTQGNINSRSIDP